MSENTTGKADDIRSWNLFQRLSAITAEMPIVPKNLSVSTGYGRASYKAVSERDILDMVKPLETKYRVFSYPIKNEITTMDTLTKTRTDNQGNKNESTSFRILLSSTYRFINIDNPEEYIDITMYGDGIDSGDKAPGKAATYAAKYALMKAYKISTGDDPDAEPSPENGYRSTGNNKGSKCADCGATVFDMSLIEATKRDFKRCLCLECARKAEQQAKNTPR